MLDQWTYTLGLGVTIACSPFGIRGSVACFNLALATVSAAAKFLATRNFIEVRQAYYASTGEAKMVYRGAIRDPYGRYTFSSDSVSVYYQCGSMSAAKACSEVLAGIRSAYSLDWYCGAPRRIVWT